MYKELKTAGHDVNMVVVNATYAEATVNTLIGACALPIFQDVDAVGAWTQHAAGKDDILIYTAAGTLHAYLPFGGSVDINLSGQAGYDNVKAALLAAKAAGTPP